MPARRHPAVPGHLHLGRELARGAGRALAVGSVDGTHHVIELTVDTRRRGCVTLRRSADTAGESSGGRSFIFRSSGLRSSGDPRGTRRPARLDRPGDHSPTTVEGSRWNRPRPRDPVRGALGRPQMIASAITPTVQRRPSAMTSGRAFAPVVYRLETSRLHSSLPAGPKDGEWSTPPSLTGYPLLR